MEVPRLLWQVVGRGRRRTAGIGLVRHWAELSIRAPERSTFRLLKRGEALALVDECWPQMQAGPQPNQDLWRS